MNTSPLRLAAVAALALAPLSGRAQTTSINYRAVPSATTLSAGQTLNISFFMDVNSLLPATPSYVSDNYTGARIYFVYAQKAGGTPLSPFSSAVNTFNTTTSGFTTVLNNSDQPALQVASGGTTYLGDSFSLTSSPTLRTDKGTFQLATLTTTLRSDLAAGDYTFGFQNLPGIRGITRVEGKFGPGNFGDPGTNDILVPPDLGVNSFTLHVASAPVPEAGTSVSLGLLLALGGGALLVRRRRAA